MSEDPTIEQATIEHAGGEAGQEACGSCGFPLAADQRYCLNCGTRRSEPRVDYAPYLGERVPAGAVEQPAAALAAPVTAAAREPSPLIAVGGIALLGVMLLIGVLIGRGDGSGSEGAATPTVVTVGEQGAPVADAAATEGTSAGAGADKTAKADDSSGGGNGGSEKVDAANSSTPGSIDNPEVANLEELDSLENSTGEAQQQASEDLPDTIAIPGEPPPTDNEEPGGGTSATVVK